VYVFCANDALLYTLLTGQPVTLEADPPVGKSFTLELTPEGPERFDLWQSLVSDLGALPQAEGVPSKSCPYHHLFEKPGDADSWHGELPPSLAPVVQLLPLREGWQRARARVEALASDESASESKAESETESETAGSRWA
jgi:hypothetical protein